MTVCYPGWIGRIISTNCCIHAVAPPDDEPRYARNMWKLKKYTKNKLCIKLVFLYTFISRCRSKKQKTKNRVFWFKRTPLTGRTLNQYKRREENQLDATEWFIALLICSTCFGHLYAHHEELETILVLLPHMVCNALVAGGRRSGARAASLIPDA